MMDVLGIFIVTNDVIVVSDNDNCNGSGFSNVVSDGDVR